ncbi:MAG: hypothetical protein WAV95_11975 [Azonexus sp.]
MPSAYTTRVCPVDSLSPEQIRAMTELYLALYAGSSPQRFGDDLREKDEALLLFHDGELVGFTLIMSYAATRHAQPVRIVYSGDTVVARPHWGQQALAFAWLAHIGEIRRQAPSTPLYWFLLVKGHRTFKYLSVFAHDFFPHWQTPQPELQALARQLAAERYGSCFDAARGIVHFPVSQGHLRPELAEATPEELSKPAVRFFFERNPGFRTGDELVCLCEIEAGNMKPLAARIFRRALDGGEHAG